MKITGIFNPRFIFHIKNLHTKAILTNFEDLNSNNDNESWK